MTAQLNDLFRQIIQSEIKAEEKKALLDKVKQGIADHTLKVKDTQEECKSLQGQLALKVHQLSESEMQLKLQRNRSKILKEQRDAQREACNQFIKKKKDVKEELDRNAEKFSATVDTYYNEFDLIATINNQRGILAQDEIVILKKEEKSLHEELKSYNERQDAISELNGQLLSLQKDIVQRKELSKELGSKIQEQLKETQKLKEEKDNVASIPQTDHEFKRLNKELDTYNEIGKQLQDMCSALQAELQELKQAKWRNQLQQSRKQQSKRGKEYKQSKQQESSNFKRLANYAAGSTAEQNTDLRSDFVAASALLEEDDALFEGSCTPVPTKGRKINLSKLSEGLKAKKSEVHSPDQPVWRLQRTGKFQFRKQGNKTS